MSAPWWQPYRDWVRRHWKVLRRIVIAGFATLVCVLLGLAIAEVDWHKVLLSLRELPIMPLVWAAGFTAASYLLYGSFDLLGRWYTGHGLTWWRSTLVGFICYAFTMSLGAPVGVVGMRLRLYSKQGLAQGAIMRILAIVLATNWIGYLFATGVVLTLGLVSLPEKWVLGDDILRPIGALCLFAGALYVAASAWSRRRSWTVFGHLIELPDLRLALVQSMLGAANWMLIAAVLYALFQGRVDYFEVLGILLISAIVGAMAHVPGGIGVLEYVFITMLAAQLPRNEVLAVVLVYRLFYYIVPLLAAALAYLGAEAGIKTVVQRAS